MSKNCSLIFTCTLRPIVLHWFFVQLWWHFRRISRHFLCTFCTIVMYSLFIVDINVSMIIIHLIIYFCWNKTWNIDSFIKMKLNRIKIIVSSWCLCLFIKTCAASSDLIWLNVVWCNKLKLELVTLTWLFICSLCSMKSRFLKKMLFIQ